MPITVSWDDSDHTITRVQFEGGFRFDDILSAWQQELDLIGSVDHAVYSLNAFGRIPFSARGFSVAKLRAFSERIHAPNLQLTVQVAENRALRTFIQQLPLNLPNDRVVVKSEVEAYRLIEQYKAKLERISHE